MLSRTSCLARAAGVVLTTLLALDAHAGTMRLARPVTLVRDEAVVMAFQDVTVCRDWFYLPSRQVARGNFRHEVTVRRGDDPGQTTLVNSLHLDATPELTPEDFTKLKGELARFMAHDPVCGKERLTPADINLNAAPVLLVNEEHGTSELGTFEQLRTASTYWADVRVTYSVDASDPGSERRVRDLVTHSTGHRSIIGQVYYRLEGIRHESSASLKVSLVIDDRLRRALKTSACADEACRQRVFSDVIGAGATSIDLDVGAAAGNSAEKSERIAEQLRSQWVEENVPKLVAAAADPSQQRFEGVVTQTQLIPGHMVFAVPLFVADLNVANFRDEALQTELVKCATKAYPTQSRSFRGATDRQPLPVAAQCLRDDQ